jgi:hemolysin activation/secretion protein
VVHGSLEYGYHWFEVFYDTGAIWNRTQDREQKQSLGAGVKTKDGFQLAFACPLRSGHAAPVFIAGMNF